MIWKLSGPSGKWKDGLETFQMIRKLSRQFRKRQKKLCICREIDFNTHFFDAFGAKTIYAVRPESVCALQKYSGEVILVIWQESEVGGNPLLTISQGIRRKVDLPLYYLNLFPSHILAACLFFTSAPSLSLAIHWTFRHSHVQSFPQSYIS